jgi:hypothetical protein
MVNTRTLPAEVIGNAATGSAATGSVATGSGATGSAATGSGATMERPTNPTNKEKPKEKLSGDNEEHVKMEFLKNLIANFDVLVVDHLDKTARNAIIKQLEMTDEKEYTRVKLAIEARVLDLLSECDLKNLPTVAFFRQVVSVLATRYAYIFLTDPKVIVQGMPVRRFKGRHSGGVTGVTCLPKTMQQKFAKMMDHKLGVERKVRKKDLPDDDKEQERVKRKKKVYGIKNDKYYVKDIVDEETFLEELSFVTTVEEREEMFSRHRKIVQFCLSQKGDIFTAVPGFFDSLLHVENHFEWLIGQSIIETINTELPKQFQLIKAVVLKICATKEFMLNLQMAKLKGADLNGSYVPELICLLRQLNTQWHKVPGGLFRFPGEPEGKSPNILCRDGIGSVSFDVHAEEKKVFEDVNICEALRGFFSIAFIGNMHYPELGEGVAILLQRKVAGINIEGAFSPTY